MIKEYTVSELIKILFKHLVMVIVLGIIFGGAFGLYAHKKQNTTYTATSRLVIQHKIPETDIKDSNSQLRADINMMDTNVSFLHDGTILKTIKNQLNKKYNLKYSTSELSKMITGETHENSVVMSIETSSSNSKKAKQVANVAASVYQQNANNLNVNMGEVTISSNANQNIVTSTTSPSVKKYVLLGVAIGMFIGIIVAFIIESMKLMK